MKKQATNLEKIFANYVSDTGLISRIYKELSKLNSKKIRQSNYKMNKKHEKDVCMTNKHMKRCSVSLAIREMQIKASMRYHCISSKKGYHQKEHK